MNRQLLPPPTTGVHSWLYGRAIYLRREGLDQFAALAELSRHVGVSTFRDGRSVSAREIADAVGSAYRGPTAPSLRAPGKAVEVQEIADYREEAGWPLEMPLPRAEIDRARLARVLSAAGEFELVDLWASAPVRPPDTAAPRWALGQLFGSDELLCIGRSSADFTAKPLHDWADGELLASQLIVPNGLRKIEGRTKDGKNSAHSRDAVGTRRFIVVESDAGLDADQQAKILEHLRSVTKARLAAVVLSGGKSVHGWFRCDGVPAAQLHRWFNYAVSIGADPRLWLPEQFVRLPDGLRDNGARQSLLYLNPTP